MDSYSISGVNAIMPGVVAYISFGSNIGDRLATIHAAIAMISTDPYCISTKSSQIYTTLPVGMAADAGPFLNGVIQVETSASLDYFFTRLTEIECELGRTDKGTYQSRSIDLDLIFWGVHIIDTPELRVPHSRYRDRRFVLEPLLELNPMIRDPETGVLVSSYLMGDTE
jgi:2-amino-4-hydroxy-6-hydroxymethyldihydropteridine diphosphokinase